MGQVAAYNPDEALKLENQICFPLYAAAREIVRRYTPHLDKIGLTYTQYITMMVLWETDSVTIKDLCSRLMLDSGTMTPMLKKLEARGLVKRERSPQDERKVIVSLTDEGAALKKQAGEVPLKMAKCVNLTMEEAIELKSLLHKAMASVDESGGAE